MADYRVTEIVENKRIGGPLYYGPGEVPGQHAITAKIQTEANLP